MEIRLQKFKKDVDFRCPFVLTLPFLFYSHALSQETNKLAKDVKNLLHDLTDYSRTERYDQFDNRQVSHLLLILLMQRYLRYKKSQPGCKWTGKV